MREKIIIGTFKEKLSKFLKEAIINSRKIKELCKKGVVLRDFPGGTVVKNPPANAGDTGSSPGLERSHMLQSN